MEPDRVVRIRVAPGVADDDPGSAPTSGDAACGGEPEVDYRFGSGYLVAAELVLTASHVLAPPDGSRPGRPGDACGILPWELIDEAADDGAWVCGTVVVCNPAAHLAVVEVPGLGLGMAPVQWGRLSGPKKVGWEAVGFPLAGLGRTGRKEEHVWGEVSPVSESSDGTLGLIVGSRDVDDDATSDLGWGGLSGAAILSSGRVVGVVTDHPTSYRRTLAGVRIEVVADHPELYEALGRPDLAPVMAPAEARRLRALDGFAAALRHYSEQLPYVAIQRIAVRGDRRVPPLSDIYIEQQQEEEQDKKDKDRHGRQGDPVEQDRRPADRRGTGASADAESEGEGSVAIRETASEALEHHRHLLIQGRPGIGKSTLLNHLTSVSILSVLSGPHGVAGPGPGPATTAAGVRRHGFPVRVSARRLAAADGSFAAALRQAATEELGLDLAFELPPGIFEHPPGPAEPWLVLVDAVDEILDGATRRKLVESLNAAAHRPDLYRFVLTNRPIAELKGFSKDSFRRYQLRPFDRAQMRSFVSRWFSIRSADPETDIEAFLRQVDASRIDDLAATPLLLTMAAILFEDRQGADLPPTRAHLYGDFVSMLLVDEESNRSTREAFVREWRRRHGDAGAAVADRLFEERRTLLVKLARLQLDPDVGSGSEALVARLAAWANREGLVPPDVAGSWLGDQVTTLLGRTGVVVEHAGELTFVHETFREFFIAAALSGETSMTTRSARALVDQWRYTEMREIVLFAIALWGDGAPVSATTSLLRRIWRPPRWRWPRRGDFGSTRALVTVASAIAEGATVQPRYESQVVKALVDQAGSTNAMARLVQLRRTDELRRLAFDGPTATVRVRAAQALLDLGELDLGRDALLTIDPHLTSDPFTVPRILRERGFEEDYLSKLRRILEGRVATSSTKIRAILELVAAGGMTIAEAEPRLDHIAAQVELGNSSVGAARLVAMVRSGETLPSFDGYRAMGKVRWGLCPFDRSDVVIGTLQSVAEGTGGRDLHLKAARALALLGYEDIAVAVAFRSISSARSASSRSARSTYRWTFVVREGIPLLAELGAQAELRELANDRGLDFGVRLDAAVVLVSPEDLALLVQLAGEGGSTLGELLRLSKELAARGQESLALAGLLDRFEAKMSSDDRLKIAELVAELGGFEHIRSALGEVVSRWWTRLRRRHKVAELLVRHGDNDPVRRAVFQRRLRFQHRADLAGVLADTGDLEPLRQLAATTRWRNRRLAVAGALAAAGDMETLRGLASVATRTLQMQLGAARALALYGDWEPLRRFATDERNPYDRRVRAALDLASEGHGETLRVIMRDPATPSGERIRIARYLARREEDVGSVELFRAVVDDPRAAPGHRVIAARVLVKAGETDAVEVLRQVADSTRSPLAARQAALGELLGQGSIGDVARIAREGRAPVLILARLRRYAVLLLRRGASGRAASVGTRRVAIQALREHEARGRLRLSDVGTGVCLVIRAVLLVALFATTTVIVGRSFQWLAESAAWVATPGRLGFAGVSVMVWVAAAMAHARRTDEAWPVRTSLGSIVGRWPPLLIFLTGPVVVWAGSSAVASALGAVGFPEVVAFNVCFAALTIAGVLVALSRVVRGLPPSDLS